MNDYTHTGVNQLFKNFNEETSEIDSNFTKEEIFILLATNNETITVFTN